jgi:hypothetical protein
MITNHPLLARPSAGLAADRRLAVKIGYLPSMPHTGGQRKRSRWRIGHLPDLVTDPSTVATRRAALGAVSGACRIAGTRAWLPSLMSWTVTGVGATTVPSGTHRVLERGREAFDLPVPAPIWVRSVRRRGRRRR